MKKKKKKRIKFTYKDRIRPDQTDIMKMMDKVFGKAKA